MDLLSSEVMVWGLLHSKANKDILHVCAWHLLEIKLFVYRNISLNQMIPHNTWICEVT